MRWQKTEEGVLALNQIPLGPLFYVGACDMYCELQNDGEGIGSQGKKPRIGWHEPQLQMPP